MALSQEDAIKLYLHLSANKQLKNGITLSKPCLLYKNIWDIPGNNESILSSQIIDHLKNVLPTKESLKQYKNNKLELNQINSNNSNNTSINTDLSDQKYENEEKEEENKKEILMITTSTENENENENENPNKNQNQNNIKDQNSINNNNSMNNNGKIKNGYHHPLNNNSNISLNSNNSNNGNMIIFPNITLTIGSIKNWKIYQRIGYGTFSEVFECKKITKHNDHNNNNNNNDNNNNNNKFDSYCVKILKPRSESILKKEIGILQLLSNGPNIIQLLHTLYDNETNLFCLVFELIKYKELKDALNEWNDYDFRYYMYQILKGINFAHSQNIMHRDIKPDNILIDTKKKELRIIDWGIADFYILNQEYSVRVATRAYKAPELLVGYKYYDYAIDLWAFGCMFASIMFNKQYFFHGTDFSEQLIKIIEVLGSQSFDKFIKKYNIKKPNFIPGKPFKKKSI